MLKSEILFAGRLENGQVGIPPVRKQSSCRPIMTVSPFHGQLQYHVPSNNESIDRAPGIGMNRHCANGLTNSFVVHKNIVTGGSTELSLYRCVHLNSSFIAKEAHNTRS